MTGNIPITITFIASTNLTMMFTIRRVGKKGGVGRRGDGFLAKEEGGERLLAQGRRRRGGDSFSGPKKKGGWLLLWAEREPPHPAAAIGTI